MSETFVDQPTVDMAPAHLWGELSLNQLIETKTQIMNKLYMAGGKPAYVKPLQAALNRLEELISSKLANPEL
jgi:hypothetical protein